MIASLFGLSVVTQSCSGMRSVQELVVGGLIIRELWLQPAQCGDVNKSPVSVAVAETDPAALKHKYLLAREVTGCSNLDQPESRYGSARITVWTEPWQLSKCDVGA